MIFIHHFVWWLMASLGMILSYFMSKLRIFQYDFIRYFILFFSIGIFIHVFLIDGITYTRMFEHNISSFDKYIVQCRHKPDCHLGTVESLLSRVFSDPWDIEYIKEIEKGCE